ncbi:Glycine/D-amino acid oxidases (deaminating) [Escherichia coli]|nr:Glycine/D-amino acid oxidases (deaminating) [Escherichia coli]
MNKLRALRQIAAALLYPQGGWLCPAELTRNVLELAQQQGLQIYYQYQLQNLSRKDDCWLLNFAGDQQSNTQRSGTGERASNQPIQPNVDSPGVFGCRAGQPIFRQRRNWQS